MSLRHVALFYIGLAFMAAGCAAFVAGLAYLTWLIISEPTIVKNETGTRVLMQFYEYLPVGR